MVHRIYSIPSSDFSDIPPSNVSQAVALVSCIQKLYRSNLCRDNRCPSLCVCFCCVRPHKCRVSIFNLLKPSGNFTYDQV
jgi:hypothetical protein